MRKRILFVVVLSVTTLTLAAPRAWAHGVVGDYVFLEPLITQDPTPANELDLMPAWVKDGSANNYSISWSIEKVLWIDDHQMPRVSMGIGTGWQHQSPYQGPSQQGFFGLTTFAKYALFYSLKHEFLTSLALQLQLPTGNTRIQSSSHTALGPVFLWEKAMGDLPSSSWVKYMRPFGIQSDFGFVPAIGGPTNHHIFADAVIQYSLPYLSNNVQDIGLRWPFRNLYFFNEFNYDQLLRGPRGQTFPTILATPGIAYVSYHFELSLGTQFALNQATVSSNHAAIFGLLDIFYDSFLPRLGNWTINKGFPECGLPL
jgi:hypothetical protein